MTTITRKFEIEPENIDPVISLFFDGEMNAEIGNGDLVPFWSRDKIMMMQDFEHSIRTELIVLDLTPLFDSFYANPENEVGFFEALEKALNERGLFTYNSDTRFGIYRAEDVNLQDADIINCLADNDERQTITIVIENVKAIHAELVRGNIIQHIEEEKRCNVFQSDMRYFLRNN